MADNVQFDYTRSEDSDPKYVNGCCGGRTPKGEIVISFFREDPPMLSSETYELDPNGQLGERVSFESERETMLRSIRCSVIMSLDSAGEIYDWLGKLLGK